MAGLTYNTYTADMATLMVVPVNDPNFVEILPLMVDAAELRILRDLDLLATRVSSTALLTAGNRNLGLPGGNAFFVVEDINVITPAGTTDPELGTRNPVLPATKEMCDFLYPSIAASGVPQFFGRVTQSTIVLGPWPGAAYTVEVVGTQRPPSLSNAVQTTFISVYFPDLLIASSMIFAAGYQQNFSAMADSPQQGMSWKSYYDSILTSATVEENRKKFSAEGWSDKQPSPIATPPRT